MVRLQLGHQSAGGDGPRSLGIESRNELDGSGWNGLDALP